jgi:hypothetical protein
VGSSHGSSRRGSGRQICSVEEEEGAERSILPKVAATEFTGGSQNRRAMVRRLGFRGSQSSGERGERSERSHVGWVGLTDPDPGLFGLVG